MQFYAPIYPSQRQNLLPTLEIITHKFQNFQKIQYYGKKLDFGFFFRNFENYENFDLKFPK